jgi:hypothetical protein
MGNWKDNIVTEETSQESSIPTAKSWRDAITEDSLTGTKTNDYPQEGEPLNTKSLAATTGGATEAIRRGASNVGQKFIEGIGVLSPAEMETITNSPQAYARSRTYPELLNKFNELSESTRQKAYNFAEEGKESLKALPDVEVSKLKPALGNIESVPLKNLPDSELPKPTYSNKSVTELESLLNEKKALQSKLAGIVESGIETFDTPKEIQAINERLSDIDKKSSSLVSSGIDEMRNPKMPTNADFSKATGFPEDILEARPELKNKQIQKIYGNTLNKELAFLQGEGTIPAYDIGKKYIPALQDAATYDPLGPVPQDAKFKQEMARNIQNQFIDEIPGTEEYARGQKLSQKAIHQEEYFKKFGVKVEVNPLTGKSEFAVASPEKLNNFFENGTPEELSKFNKVVEEAQDLGFNPESSIDSEKMKQIDRFQDEIPLRKIKDKVKGAKDTRLVSNIKRLLGISIGGTIGSAGGPVGGALGSAAGLGIAEATPKGARLQEMMATLKGSGAYKTAAKASKFAGPVVGALSAGVTYKDLLNQGKSHPEAGALTAAELVNPIPGTDVTGAYDAARESYAREDKVLPAASAATQAYLKPISKTIQRTQDYDSYDPLDPFSKAAKATPKMYRFESTDDSDMTEFANTMEASGDKAAQEYSRVLRQIISAPESKKSAILSTLNQQTAFRELVKKMKGEE